MLGYRLVKETEYEQLQHGLTERLVLDGQLAEARATVRQAEARVTEANDSNLLSLARARSAEAMVQLQAKSIERLMASNDRMVGLVADMRRVGFGILEPIETNDTPATTAEYDREAVTRDPALAADDD